MPRIQIKPEPTASPTTSGYAAFLAAKSIRAKQVGLASIPELSADLFQFQAHITQWALRKGRAAIFAGCGLGKSWMALEWARCVAEYMDAPVLILTPLAVAAQFVREGVKLGVPVVQLRDELPAYESGVYVANYERLDKLASLVARLGGIVLDESSILKSFDGKTRTALIEAFAHVPFKLCCTATPSPNDVAELGNHAEFLGVMRRVDMLNRFFEHAGDDVAKWTLKGHARKPFWQWCASWCIVASKPSDLGFEDTGYELPPMRVHHHVIDVDQKMAKQQGMLFAYEATTLSEQREVRRASLDERVQACADAVNVQSMDQWLVFCDLNDESAALTKAIDGAVEVTGSDSAESKEQAILDHIDGKARVLVSKSSIIGFGINAQHCSNQFHVGIGHSFESYYQAVRRSWRFGQTEPVDIHLAYTSADGHIARNLARKQAEHEGMVREMVEVMRGNS